MYVLLKNEEQTHIADSVQQFLAAELPLERWRPNTPAADDRQHWPQMQALGWLGLGIDEQHGGVGYGLAEEILLLRECGRYLLTPTFMATLMAAHIAAAADQRRLVESLLAGEHCAAPTLLLPSANDREPAGNDANAYVFDYRAGDLLLLEEAGGFALYRSDAIKQSEQRPCLDDSLALTQVTLALTDPLCRVSEAESLQCRWRVMLAALNCGLAEAARDHAVAYAKVREQFGSAIGKFQAVKHKCSDMAVRAELAWAQTMEAALDCQHQQANAVLKSASAKWLATDAAHRNAADCVQVHGGMGFQAECNAQLFVKRAHLYDQLGGTMAQQLHHLLQADSPL